MCSKSHARVLHCQLHKGTDICPTGSGRDGDPPTSGRELAGIIGQSVEHEEREGAVCLDDEVGGLHVKGQLLLVKGIMILGDGVEERLQRERGKLQSELPLLHLNPVCQQVIIGRDAVGEFVDVGE